MSFESLVNSVKLFLRRNCPTFDSSRIFLSPAQTDAFCENLFLDSNFLARLGFPLSVTESSVGDTTISVKPSLTEKSSVSVKIKDFVITASPFDNFVYDPKTSIEMANTDVEIENLRLTILIHSKDADYIMITASKIKCAIDLEKKGEIDIQGLSIFIGCEPILSYIDIPATFNYVNNVFVAEIALEKLKIEMSSTQFNSFIKIWSSFTGNNFKSNKIHIRCSEVHAMLGSGSRAEVKKMDLTFGNEVDLKIENVKLNIASVVFVLTDIIYTNEKINVDTITIPNNSRVALEVEKTPFISGDSSHRVIQGFTVSCDASFLGFFLSAVRDNILFNFITKHSDADAPITSFNGITIKVKEGPTVSFLLTTSYKRQLEQYNITQFTVKNDKIQPIIEDQIIQFIFVHRGEVESVSFFTSPLNINVSFDELDKIISVIKSFKKNYEPKLKLRKFDINLPNCALTLGIKHGNSIEPVIRFNLKTFTTKGVYEEHMVKYNFAPTFSINYYNQENSNWIPLIEETQGNLIIKEKASGKRLINVSFKDAINSIITTEFLKIFSSKYKKHDTLNGKDVYIINRTNQVFSLICNDKEIKIKSNTKGQIDPNAMYCFTKAMPKVSIDNLFSGFTIDNNTILLVNSTKHDKEIVISTRQTIRNYLPITIKLFTPKRKEVLSIKSCEEKHVNEYMTSAIIACDLICAKASDVADLRLMRSNYSIISNGVQTACIIERNGNTIEIRSFYKIINSLGFSVDVIISTANIPNSFTIKDTETILLPYFESVPINVEVSMKGRKKYSAPAELGQPILMQDENGKFIKLVSRSKINQSGQMEISILPFFSILNKSTTPLHVVYNKETILLDPASYSLSLPYFIKDKGVGIITERGAKLSVSGATEIVDLPNETKTLLLPLKTNSALFYPLYCSVSDSQVVITDAVIIHNELDTGITLIIDKIIFLDFNAKETGRVSILNKDTIASLSLGEQGEYKEVDGINLTLQTMSTTLHFRSETKHVFVDLDIIKTASCFDVTLSYPKEPKYVFINDCDVEAQIIQQNYDCPLTVLPHSAHQFGFVCPFEKSNVTVTVERKSFNLSFMKLAKEYTEVGKKKIYFTSKILGEGIRALHISNEEMKEEKGMMKNTYSLSFKEINVNICSDKKELFNIMMNNLIFVISKKKSHRILQVDVGAVTAYNYLSSMKGPLFETISGKSSFLSIFGTFGGNKVSSKTNHTLNVILGEFTLRFDADTVNQIKSTFKDVEFNELKKLQKTLITSKEITLHPVQFNYNYENKECSSVILPSTDINDINGTLGALASFLNDLYKKRINVLYTNDKTRTLRISNSFIGSIKYAFYEPSDAPVVDLPFPLTCQQLQQVQYEKPKIEQIQVVKGSTVTKKFKDSVPAKLRTGKEYTHFIISFVPSLIDTICKEQIICTFKSVSGRKLLAVGKSAFFSVDLTQNISTIYPYTSTQPVSINETKVTVIDITRTKVIIPFESKDEAEKFFLIIWSMRMEL